MLSEKASLVLLGGFATVVSLMPWSVAPTPVPLILWGLRIGLPLIATVAIAYVVWLNARKDLAPDFLSAMFRSRCECAGLCFATEQHVRNDVAYVDLYYQNRYDRPCKMTLTMNVVKRNANAQLLHVRIVSAGGAFGVYRIPMSVSLEVQGSKQTIEIEATNLYPDGRGALLRMQGGSLVGTLPLAWSVLSSILNLYFGVYATLAESESRLQIKLPSNVAQKIPDDLIPEHEELWLPGDDVLDVTSIKSAPAERKSLCDSQPVTV